MEASKLQGAWHFILTKTPSVTEEEMKELQALCDKPADFVLEEYEKWYEAQPPQVRRLLLEYVLEKTADEFTKVEQACTKRPEIRISLTLLYGALYEQHYFVFNCINQLLPLVTETKCKLVQPIHGNEFIDILTAKLSTLPLTATRQEVMDRIHAAQGEFKRREPICLGR